MSERTGFDCINASSSEATTLCQRAQHLARAVENKLSALRTPVSADEVILGTTPERLRPIPVEDFDSTRAELAKFIKKNGCCEVTVNGERTRLSDLAIQVDGVADMLEPYRKFLPKVSP